MRRRKNANANDDDNGFAAWGGYMEAKKAKLREQFSDASKNETTKKSHIFSGISIFVNGYTKPSADELKQLMTLHDGVYHHYHMPNKTKFIIASNLPDVKIKQLGAGQKIIKPEWITDSIKAGRLLDYSNYLLYTNHNRKQPKLKFEKLEKKLDYKKIKTTQDCEISFNLTNRLSPELFDECDDNRTAEKENSLQENLQSKNDTTHTGASKNSLASNSEKRTEQLKSGIANNATGPIKGKSTRILNTNDPKFISEFYNNSRLHHISTLGATFKQHVYNLRQQSDFKFPKRKKFIDYLANLKQRSVPNVGKTSLKRSEGSVIMHIDMDCFFVSVGLRKRPELRGIPVAVTHSKSGHEPGVRAGVDRRAELQCYQQRVQDKLKSKGVNSLGPGNMLVRLEGIENSSMSEIASCSYEAREAGVKNGMFVGAALKLCPNLQTIPYDFDEYKEVAFTLYDTIAQYTLNIEAVSCDEMFVDISSLLESSGSSVDDWATYIRSLIQSRTGCPCSTGFGTNRLQARLATRTAKPNGQFHLKPEHLDEYMEHVAVTDLPGVGNSMSLKLSSLDMKTCADLQLLTLAQLKSHFGLKQGETLHQNCRGIDNKTLVYEHERKSVSAEINYGIRFTNHAEMETFLKQLATEVHSRLTEIQMKGKCITLKLAVRAEDAPAESSKYMGHGICDYVSKSTTLPKAVCDLDTIMREVLQIVQKYPFPPSELRGVGIQISRLERENQPKSSILTKFLSTKSSSKNTSAANIQSGTNSSSCANADVKNYVKPETTITELQRALKIDEDSKCDENFIGQPTKSESDRENPSESLKKFIINLDQNHKNSNEVEGKHVKSAKNAQNPEIDDRKKDQSSHVVNKGTNNVNQIGVKRGRGRPRGSSNRTIVRKNSNNGNGNLDQFLNPQTNQVPDLEPLYPNIDMEVFAALPEDIRQEISHQYKMQSINIADMFSNNFERNNSSNNVTKRNVELSRSTKNSFSPSEIKGDSKQNCKGPVNNSEIKKNHHSCYISDSFQEHSIKVEDVNQKTNRKNQNHLLVVESKKHSEECVGKNARLEKSDKKCIFSSLDVKDLKNLLHNWVESETAPETCDAEMLGEFCKKLTSEKRINDLFVILKFLYSEIRQKTTSCGWHRAYYLVLNCAQSGMMENYGSTLWSYKDFQCTNRCYLDFKIHI